tara:strand:- start:779 stop:1114 length:336 start_codon:yes stop_codon:yes gene_type:complete
VFLTPHTKDALLPYVAHARFPQVSPESPFVLDLEIVSLVGTLSSDRSHHLHLSVSKADGSVVGGHVKGPATVRTTAELVLGAMPALSFGREFEPATGYLELRIGGGCVSTE